MLDAVVEYLPSPTEVKAIEGELENGEQGTREATTAPLCRIGLQDCH